MMSVWMTWAKANTPYSEQAALMEEMLSVKRDLLYGDIGSHVALKTIPGLSIGCIMICVAVR
jgi:hypothetical protein